MNEFDLIKRYLEKSGAYRIVNVSYYNEGKQLTANTTVMLGLVAGHPSGKVFCFGNLEISFSLGGVIVLTNGNSLWTKLQTTPPGLAEPGSYNNYLNIGAGLSLLGNGTYYGYKRIYGVGFNRIDFTAVDIGAATFVLNWNFNGYLFRLR